MEGQAIQAAAEARAISELARHVLQPDLRAIRAAAARIVVDAAGGSESEAARRMGIRQPTLHDLVKLPEPEEF